MNDPDRSQDVVFLHTTGVVQTVIDLNNGLPFARADDYSEFVRVSTKAVNNIRQNDVSLIVVSGKHDELNVIKFGNTTPDACSEFRVDVPGLRVRVSCKGNVVVVVVVVR